MRFKPKCIHKNDKGGSTGIAYNNKGFLLPCCWADGMENYDQFSAFYDESLNIKNSSVEEIMTSDVWVDFFYNIINEVDLPDMCKQMCMESNDADPFRHHIFYEDGNFFRKK